MDDATKDLLEPYLKLLSSSDKLGRYERAFFKYYMEMHSSNKITDAFVQRCIERGGGTFVFGNVTSSQRAWLTSKDIWRKEPGNERLGLGYCFTPYQRLWLYNSAPLVAFYDTLGIRRMYSRLKPRRPHGGRNERKYVKRLTLKKGPEETTFCILEWQFKRVWKCRSGWRGHRNRNGRGQCAGGGTERRGWWCNGDWKVRSHPRLPCSLG